MKLTNHYKHLCLLLLWGCLGLFSCTSTKNIPYFKDIPDTLNKVYTRPVASYTEPIIRSNDILQISIQTIDPQTNLEIGTSITASNFSAATPGAVAQLSGNNNGFLVDHDGFVELPLVGRVKVGGLTTLQAREQIREKANKYYNDPIVNIRFANFTISVIGEVTRPGVYPIVNEKASVLDAIALSNDLSIFAKRRNIMIIREENGVKSFIRLNITSTELMNSPFYYLRQGDIIYVEPNKSKVAANDMAMIRNVSISTAAASLLSVILSKVK